MPRLRLLPPMLVIGLVLSACLGGTDPTPSATPQPTPTTTPEPTEEATATPTAAPTATAEATATPSPVTSGPPGGFAVAPHPEADSLFLDRDTCTNERDNYEVTFPDDWWTNTEIGRNPACIWFSPTTYQVPDPTVVPDEIAITITWMEGDSGSFEEAIRRDFVTVGGQPAVRVEYEGRSVYQVQLGPTPEEGPNLLVETSEEMGGDYELNRAVMDRMMATMEFFGSTQ